MREAREGRRAYDPIAAAPRQTFRIGVSSHLQLIKSCVPEQPVELVRELDHPFDRNAIAVEVDGGRIGRVAGAHAEWLAEKLDRGRVVSARIRSVDPLPGRSALPSVTLAVVIEMI